MWLVLSAYDNSYVNCEYPLLASRLECFVLDSCCILASLNGLEILCSVFNIRLRHALPILRPEGMSIMFMRSHHH